MIEQKVFDSNPKPMIYIQLNLKVFLNQATLENQEC